MTSHMPGHGREHSTAYDPRWGPIIGLLGATLMCAVIVGLFMFITWFTYATN